MNTFWVEVYEPAWTHAKMRYRVWDEYPRDELSPSLTHLFEVKATDQDEAIARVLVGQGRKLVAPGGV